MGGAYINEAKLGGDEGVWLRQVYIAIGDCLEPAAEPLRGQSLLRILCSIPGLHLMCLPLQE